MPDILDYDSFETWEHLLTIVDNVMPYIQEDQTQEDIAMDPRTQDSFWCQEYENFIWLFDQLMVIDQEKLHEALNEMRTKRHHIDFLKTYEMMMETLSSLVMSVIDAYINHRMYTESQHTPEEIAMQDIPTPFSGRRLSPTQEKVQTKKINRYAKTLSTFLWYKRKNDKACHAFFDEILEQWSVLKVIANQKEIAPHDALYMLTLIHRWALYHRENFYQDMEEHHVYDMWLYANLMPLFCAESKEEALGAFEQHCNIFMTWLANGCLPIDTSMIAFSLCIAKVMHTAKGYQFVSYIKSIPRSVNNKVEQNRIMTHVNKLEKQITSAIVFNSTSWRILDGFWVWLVWDKRFSFAERQKWNIYTTNMHLMDDEQRREAMDFFTQLQDTYKGVVRIEFNIMALQYLELFEEMYDLIQKSKSKTKTWSTHMMMTIKKQKQKIDTHIHKRNSFVIHHYPASEQEKILNMIKQNTEPYTSLSEIMEDL